LAGAAIAAASDIPDALPDLLAPELGLPSGGSIMIEPTRALTAIDVDAGSARDPALANREAATAIARQLRLRNIGGIVVIDFISTARNAARERLLRDLRDALADDPARLRGADRVSPLGLVELARQRRGRSLAELHRPR